VLAQQLVLLLHSNAFDCCCCCRSDLDIIIVLRCNTPSQQPFESCRMQLLGQVQQQLGKPLSSSTPRPQGAAADAADWLKEAAAHGWQLMDCVPCYYLTLQHPLLHMQLDIQVKAEVIHCCGLASYHSSQHPILQQARWCNTSLAAAASLVHGAVYTDRCVRMLTTACAGCAVPW
jgi:hypothetical protein